MTHEELPKIIEKLKLAIQKAKSEIIKMENVTARINWSIEERAKLTKITGASL